MTAADDMVKQYQRIVDRWAELQLQFMRTNPEVARLTVDLDDLWESMSQEQKNTAFASRDHCWRDAVNEARKSL